MSPREPSSDSGHFEVFSHRGMYYLAFAACVALFVAAVGVVLGAWWPDGPPRLLRFLPSRFWGGLGILYFGGIGSNLVRLMGDSWPTGSHVAVEGVAR